MTTVKCSSKEILESVISEIPTLKGKPIVKYFNWTTFSYWFKVSA